MKRTSKHTNMGMAMGMCFGISIGTSFGVACDNIAIGMCVGLSIGMALGLAIGFQKDKAVNQQLEEKGYTVKTIEKGEDDKTYKITIVNNAGEETTVDVAKGTMETELFSVGDVVFLDEEGDIEQAFDKDEA